MKCLVTKLLGVVNNKSLIKLGEKRLVANSPKGDFAVKYPASQKKDSIGLYALDSDYNILSTATIPANDNGYYMNVNTTQIDGVSYYSIKEFNSIVLINIGNSLWAKVKCPLSVFKYCKQLESITDIAHATSGDLKELSELTTLKNLNFTYNTALTGDISVLGKLVNLVTLIINTSGEISQTNVTGSIETLATSQIAAGRNSGTLSISCYGCKIKHNDKVIKSCKIAFNSSSYEVTEVVYVEV